ncbi:MAG: toll/interleukin-1 receptor domain-containing protein [Cyanobacteria bacterium P01_F01_bin.143]
MAKDYEYDIFLSYRRRNPVKGWVENHFYPLLRDWLPHVMPRKPKIFRDFDQIETGSQWALKIKQALKTSRCLVSVCSPDYFRSPWCQAEFYSMMKRENIVGLRTEDRPNGLIYPVRYSDGEHFPPEVKQMQMKDLSKWRSPSPVFAESIHFLDLEKQVQSITEELWEMINNVPQWQEDWPIITPEAYSNEDDNIQVKIPRL